MIFPNASHINVAITVDRVFITHKEKVLKELILVFKKKENLWNYIGVFELNLEIYGLFMFHVCFQWPHLHS